MLLFFKPMCMCEFQAIQKMFFWINIIVFCSLIFGTITFLFSRITMLISLRLCWFKNIIQSLQQFCSCGHYPNFHITKNWMELSFSFFPWVLLVEVPGVRPIDNCLVVRFYCNWESLSFIFGFCFLSVKQLLKPRDHVHQLETLLNHLWICDEKKVEEPFFLLFELNKKQLKPFFRCFSIKLWRVVKVFHY